MPCDKDGKLFLHGLTGSLEHHNTIVSQYIVSIQDLG